jgi:hypothetical protein
VPHVIGCPFRCEKRTGTEPHRAAVADTRVKSNYQDEQGFVFLTGTSVKSC